MEAAEMDYYMACRTSRLQHEKSAVFRQRRDMEETVISYIGRRKFENGRGT